MPEVEEHLRLWLWESMYGPDLKRSMADFLTIAPNGPVLVPIMRWKPHSRPSTVTETNAHGTTFSIWR
jgi:hypothetical protein